MSEKVGSSIENIIEVSSSPDLGEMTGNDLLLISKSNISEAISESSIKISQSVSQLEETLISLLSSSSSIALGQMILVAIIGALSAYLFNLFHWRVAEKKKRISRIGVELRSVINDLESISVDYWTKDYKEEKRHDIHAMEISIKSKVRLIPRYIKVISAELELKNTDINIQKLEEFGINIFDLATGDEFESRSRKSSKPKALKISNKCSDIRATILHLDLRA